MDRGVLAAARRRYDALSHLLVPPVPCPAAAGRRRRKLRNLAAPLKNPPKAATKRRRVATS